MDVIEVRAKIKDIISNITSIPVDQIPDGASFRDDLDLDSLSLLEIGVDVDYAFKLGVPEEQLQQLATLQDTVDLVMARVGSSAGHAGASAERSGAQTVGA